MNSADTDTDIMQSYIDLLFQVLLGDEPLSSRKVLVGVEERDEKEPDNMVYVVTKLGANVTLNCTDDDQVESVTWSREAVGDIEHVDRMLPLIHVDKNHSGVYTCSVSGSDKIRHVSLLVEHSPEIETRHSHVFARLGDNTQLSCDIAAAPVPAVARRVRHLHRFLQQERESLELVEHPEGAARVSARALAGPQRRDGSSVRRPFGFQAGIVRGSR